MKFERLGENIKQVRGISYKPSDISDIPLPDYVPVLKANNIKENGIDTTDLIYIHKGKIKPEQFIKKGDLLLAASSGSKEIVGKNIFFESDFEGSFGAFCKLVRPKSSIHPKFVGVFFKTPYFKRHIRNLINGALINNLKNEHIDSLLIPNLTKNDQLHIANILSKAESLIAQRKESIRLLDEFLKSTFLEMFGDPVRNERGWEIFALSDVCTKITDGTHDTPERLTQGVKYITGKHITPFNIDFDNSDYVTENVHKEIFRRTNVEFDDILYTNIGANVGTAARVKVKYEFSLKNVALLKQDRAKLKSHYLEHILNLSNFKQRLLSLLSIGGAQKFLNLKSIGKIKIPLPPIELQAQFAQIVEKTEALKTQYQQSLQELENLYGSLSQRAFKGELTLKQNHVHP